MWFVLVINFNPAFRATDLAGGARRFGGIEDDDRLALSAPLTVSIPRDVISVNSVRLAPSCKRRRKDQNGRTPASH